MRRIEKEILKRELKDLGDACRLAKSAGYTIDCYDGDVENGPCAPIVYFHR
jgi:hypothetical protein